MNKEQNLLLGAHVSIAGGIENCIKNGQVLNCTAIQIFVKSNRQWAPPKISDDSIVKFNEAKKQSGIRVVVAHASYLVNLAAHNPEIRKKSIESLINELAACDKLAIPYLVLHPGSYTLGEEAQAIASIAAGISEIYERYNFKTMLLLETMAGQGSSIGATFEQLAAIFKLVTCKPKVGFCLDTCHIFVAGYDITTKESFDHTFQQFDAIVGLEHLKMLHVNDSKKEAGSRVDRHEDIGKGKIGSYAFERIMNDKQFDHVIKIIETPKGDNEVADDTRNLNALRSMIK